MMFSLDSELQVWIAVDAGGLEHRRSITQRELVAKDGMRDFRAAPAREETAVGTA